MATYKQIIEWIKVSPEYGFTVKTCWIAHCKELAGIASAKLAHYNTNRRMNPCPIERQSAILDAFAHFGMLRHLGKRAG